MADFVEKIVNVSGFDINYTSVGNGKHVVFCFPGIFGTIGTDFGAILERMDGSKFTIVCWDAPGYGKSRPPIRSEYMKVGLEAYTTDGNLVCELMSILGHEKFSLLGFSGGGLTAVGMAVLHSDRIENLVLWSHPATMSARFARLMQAMGTSQFWPKDRWSAVVSLYGEPELKRIATQTSNNIKFMMTNNLDHLDDDAKGIKARTLIINGKNDPLAPETDVRLLHKAIANSKFECWQDAGHTLHLEHPDRFVQTVEHFLLN